MSFCRFGPDSDVYCYKNDHFNYTVCVAGNRIVDTPMEGGGVMRQLKSRTSKIDLPEAGTQRDFCFAEHALSFLRELRVAGYKVPEDALDSLGEEVSSIGPVPLGDMHNPEEGDPSQVSVIVLKDNDGIVVTPNSHRPPDGVNVDGMSLLELMKCEYVPLDLPDAGRRFLVQTPAEATEKLRELRALGYEVTDQYIDKISQI